MKLFWSLFRIPEQQTDLVPGVWLIYIYNIFISPRFVGIIKRPSCHITQGQGRNLIKRDYIRIIRNIRCKCNIILFALSNLCYFSSAISCKIKNKQLFSGQHLKFLCIEEHPGTQITNILKGYDALTLLEHCTMNVDCTNCT